MLKLYVARHGQTTWNTEKRMQGHKDSDLTELGRKQAAALAKAMSGITLDAVFSSSSGRALETTRITMEGRDIPIQVMDDLREINLGDWEGLTVHDVEKLYPEEHRNFWEFPHQYKPFDGETFRQVADRVRHTLEFLADHYNGKSVLIVTHTVIIRTLLTLLEKKELKDLWNGTFIYPASLCEFEYENGCWKILRSGDISHYEE